MPDYSSLVSGHWRARPPGDHHDLGGVQGQRQVERRRHFEARAPSASATCAWRRPAYTDGRIGRLGQRETAGTAVRFGIFSVQDYHPDLGIGQAAYLEQVLARMRHAESLGFDSFWLAEHHFNNYGLDPNPAVVLGAAARVTTRLRLGTAISVLPFRNPLHVAEDYALVDLLSGGRLNFGAGSGYLKHEFEGHGVPQEEKAERFDEALE